MIVRFVGTRSPHVFTTTEKQQLSRSTSQDRFQCQKEIFWRLPELVLFLTRSLAYDNVMSDPR